MFCLSYFGGGRFLGASEYEPAENMEISGLILILFSQLLSNCCFFLLNLSSSEFLSLSRGKLGCSLFNLLELIIELDISSMSYFVYLGYTIGFGIGNSENVLAKPYFSFSTCRICIVSSGVYLFEYIESLEVLICQRLFLAF